MDSFDTQLKQLRQQWQAFPNRRPIIEHMAFVIKKNEEELKELRKNVAENVL